MNIFKRKDKSADKDTAKEYVGKIVENYRKLDLDRATSLATQIINNGKIDDEKVEQFKDILKEMNQQLEEMSDDCTAAAGKSISKSGSRTADVANSLKSFLDSWLDYNASILETKFTPGAFLSDRFGYNFNQVINFLEESEKNNKRVKPSDTFSLVKRDIADLLDSARADVTDFNRTLVASGKGISSLGHVVKRTVKLPDGTKETFKETDLDLLSQAENELSNSSVKMEYKIVATAEDDIKRAKAYYRYQDRLGKLILQELVDNKKNTKNPIIRMKINKAIKFTKKWIHDSKNLASLNKKKNGDPESLPEPAAEKEKKSRTILNKYLKQVVASSTQDLKSAYKLYNTTADKAVACVEEGKTLAEIEAESPDSAGQNETNKQKSSTADVKSAENRDEKPTEKPDETPAGTDPETNEENTDTAGKKESDELNIETLRLKVAKSTARDVRKNFDELSAEALKGNPDALAAIKDIAENQSEDATYQAQRVARKFLRDKRDAIKKAQASENVARSGKLDIDTRPDPDKLFRSIEIESDGGRRTKKMAVGKHYSPQQLYNQLAADGHVNTNANVLRAVKGILLPPAKDRKVSVRHNIEILRNLASSNIAPAVAALTTLVNSGVRVVIESEQTGLSEYLTDNIRDLAENVKNLCMDAVNDKQALKELVKTAAMNEGATRLEALDKMKTYNAGLFEHAYTAANAVHGQNPNDEDFKSAILSLPDEASEWGISKAEQINAFKKVSEESVLNAQKAALIGTLRGAIAGWRNVNAIQHLYTVCAAIQAAGGAMTDAARSAAIKCCRITGVHGIDEADCTKNTLDLFKKSLTDNAMKAALDTLAGIASASLSGSKAFVEFSETTRVIVGGAHGPASAGDPVWSALIAAAGTDGGDFRPNAAACKKLEAYANLNVAGIGNLIADLRNMNNGKQGATALKNIVNANAGFVAGWQAGTGGTLANVGAVKTLLDGVGGNVGVAGADNDVKAEWFPTLGIGYDISAGANDPSIKKELDQMIIKINCKIPSAAVADKHRDILTKIDTAIKNNNPAGWQGVGGTHNIGANFAAAAVAVDPTQAEGKAAAAVETAITAPGGSPVAGGSVAFPLALKTYAICSADIDRKAIGNAALDELVDLAKTGDENAMNALNRLVVTTGGDANGTGAAVQTKNIDQIRTAFRVATASKGADDASYRKNRGDIVTVQIKTWLTDALNGDAAALTNLKNAAAKVDLPADQIYGDGAALSAVYRQRQDANRALEIYNSKQIKNDPLKTAIVNALKTVDPADPNDEKVLDPVIIQWIFDAMVPGDGFNDVNKNARMFIVNAAAAGGSQAKSVILALDKTLKLATPAPLPQADRDILAPVAVEAHKRYDAARKK